MSSYLPLHRLSEHRPLVGVKKWENRRVRPQRSVFAQFKMYEKTDITLMSVKSICGCNHQVVSFTTREEKDLLCVACSEIKPQISSNSHICETSSQRMFAWPSVHTHTHTRAGNPQNSWATSGKNIYRWERNIFLPRKKTIKKIWNINHYYPALNALILYKFRDNRWQPVGLSSST